MQLNMTWADILVSLVVGLFGSLVIILVSDRILNTQRAFLDWWASRSKAATEKRIYKLKLQVDYFLDMQFSPESSRKALSNCDVVTAFISRVGVMLMLVSISVALAIPIVARLTSPREDILLTDETIDVATVVILLASVVNAYSVVLSLFAYWKKQRDILNPERAIARLVRSVDLLEGQILKPKQEGTPS